jgi:hypothetical protein
MAELRKSWTLSAFGCSSLCWDVKLLKPRNDTQHSHSFWHKQRTRQLSQHYDWRRECTSTWALLPAGAGILPLLTPLVCQHRGNVNSVAAVTETLWECIQGRRTIRRFNPTGPRRDVPSPGRDTVGAERTSETLWTLFTFGHSKDPDSTVDIKLTLITQCFFPCDTMPTQFPHPSSILCTLGGKRSFRC